MNFGIVVEGDQDSAAYPELIRKIRNDIENVLAEPCGNDAGLRSQFVGWLKHFQWNAQYSIDKVLVIMDSDCSDPLTWEQQLKQIYERSHFVPTFPVHFHATNCELETWLLADENAVRQVSRERGKNKQVDAIAGQLESYKDAKERFQKMLSLAGLPLTAPVYREIARCADIERIATRCPLFQQFVSKVLEC
jgi:uncharacterized protein DUF4276